MGECGRWASVRIGLVFEVHGYDEALRDGEDVDDHAVGEEIALQVLDKLVHAHVNPTGLLRERSRGSTWGSNSLHCRVQ